MYTLTKEEVGLIAQIACDNESGNHLLYPRSEEYYKLQKELTEAMDIPMDKLTKRQFMLIDKYGEMFYD